MCFTTSSIHLSWKLHWIVRTGKFLGFRKNVNCFRHSQDPWFAAFYCQSEAAGTHFPKRERLHILSLKIILSTFKLMTINIIWITTTATVCSMLVWPLAFSESLKLSVYYHFRMYDRTCSTAQCDIARQTI